MGKNIERAGYTRLKKALKKYGIITDTNRPKSSRSGKGAGRGGVFSFRQLVTSLVIPALMCLGAASQGLGVTIAGSSAPGAVEFKILKEIDMNANSLSKLPRQSCFEPEMTQNKRSAGKKEKNNRPKSSRSGKVLGEVVYSFRQLVTSLVIPALMCLGAASQVLGDHIIYATHRPGAV